MAHYHGLSTREPAAGVDSEASGVADFTYPEPMIRLKRAVTTVAGFLVGRRDQEKSASNGGPPQAPKPQTRLSSHPPGHSPTRVCTSATAGIGIKRRGNSDTLLSALPNAMNALARLLEAPDTVEPFEQLLREIEPVLGAVGSALLVPDPLEPMLAILARTKGFPATPPRWIHSTRQRQPRWPEHETITLDPEESADGCQILCIELWQGSEQRGLLLFRLPEELRLSDQQLQFLDTLGGAFSSLLHSTRRAQLNHRLALYEERTAIARELHDSLAQSLSYLKIQASRLQGLLHGPQDTQLDRLEVDNIVQEFRTSLSRAYRQLRELITTCRLTMNGKSMDQALQDSVEEFEKRSTVTLDLDNRLSTNLLGVDQEMQVLHIVREALANVVRHSQASNAKVSLRCHGESEIVLSIADDGIGIEMPRDGDQHYGLVIMQERARNLGGEMRLEGGLDGGARVQVTFPRKPTTPAFERAR